MKEGIHPPYGSCTVTCMGCGYTFETRATVSKIEVNICSNCHPAYTGRERVFTDVGQVAKFRRRWYGEGAAEDQPEFPDENHDVREPNSRHSSGLRSKWRLVDDSF